VNFKERFEKKTGEKALFNSGIVKYHTNKYVAYLEFMTDSYNNTMISIRNWFTLKSTD